MLKENRTPDFLARIFCISLFKTITPTRPRHTSGFISDESGWVLELLQAIKNSCVSLLPKIPFRGSLEASWKSKDFYQLGHLEHQVNDGATG